MYDVVVAPHSLGGLGLSWNDIKNGLEIGDHLADWFGGGGSNGPQGAVSIPMQTEVFLVAWSHAPYEEKMKLCRAAAAANAPHRWASPSEVEAEPEEFVRAANGGSDGKITTSAGQQFHAVFIAFLERWAQEPGAGPGDPPGNNGGATLPGWLVDILKGAGGGGGGSGGSGGGDGGGGGGGGVPPVALMAGGALLLVLLLRRR